MGQRTLVLEALHATHIERARLTLEESEGLLVGVSVPGADAEDIGELLT